MSNKSKALYEQIEQGKWVDWGRRMDLSCCSCGFCHEIEYRLRKGKLQLKFTVNGAATGGIRRHHEHECVKVE